MPKRVACFVICLFGVLVWRSSLAFFYYIDTEKVPIDRLFANLQALLQANTNDFRLTYQLARVHAMAYATNQETANVSSRDGLPIFDHPAWYSGVPRVVQNVRTAEERESAMKHLTNAIVLYERSLALMKSATDANVWHVLEAQLGLAWSLDQSGQRSKALDAYRRTLRIAWKQEVTGDFDFKAWVNEAWNDVKSGKNPVHSQRRADSVIGVCFSEEVMEYMLKLLDPVKDKEEIARLKSDQQSLKTRGRAVTPILVPLEHNATFSDLVDPKAAVTFDLDGSGIPRQWGWPTPKAAWLVYDSDDSGEITSALQMFGSVTFWIFWEDGYAALASLDDNGDGELSGSELRHLALWQDLNCNGISDPGEVRPVQSFGITAISCSGKTHSGDMKWSPRGITFSDGEVRPTYDWIVPSR